MPTVLKSGSLNLLESSGPIQGCNGIAFPFTFTNTWCTQCQSRTTNKGWSCSLVLSLGLTSNSSQQQTWWPKCIWDNIKINPIYKKDIRVWARFIRFRHGTSGEICEHGKGPWISAKSWIFRLFERLFSSQVGFYSNTMNFLIYVSQSSRLHHATHIWEAHKGAAQRFSI